MLFNSRFDAPVPENSIVHLKWGDFRRVVQSVPKMKFLELPLVVAEVSGLPSVVTVRDSDQKSFLRCSRIPISVVLVGLRRRTANGLLGGYCGTFPY